MSNTTPQHLVSSSISKEHGIKRPVLKCGDMFALFDSSGSFRSSLQNEEGLYFDGTRFLSTKYIQVNGFPLSMMGTQVRSDGEELLVTYSNFDNAIPGIPEHSLSLVERMFLSGESCYAEIIGPRISLLRASPCLCPFTSTRTMRTSMKFEECGAMHADR